MNVYAIRYDFVVLAEDEEDAYEILYDVYGIRSEWMVGGAVNEFASGSDKITTVNEPAELPPGWTAGTPMFTRDYDETSYTFSRHLEKNKEEEEDAIIINGVKYVAVK